jgi:hypothetical protein
MPIDQPPESKPTKKTATPATTTRRSVPAKRTSTELARQYSLATLLADISNPLELIRRAEPEYQEWAKGPRQVDPATVLEHERMAYCCLPHRWELEEAATVFAAALAKPLDDATALAMLSLLLKQLGKRADAKEKLKVMLGVVADLGDPLAEMFDLSDKETRAADKANASSYGPVRMSPIVLGLAGKILLARQKFELKPAELRRACIEAFYSLARQHQLIYECLDARDRIEKYLLWRGTADDRAWVAAERSGRQQFEKWMLDEDRRDWNEWAAMANPPVKVPDLGPDPSDDHDEP